MRYYHTMIPHPTPLIPPTTQVFNTVSPALAFQYVSDNMVDLVDRVPPYTDNLNSWLGQILQRDAPHIPVEIVDVETTGYVLRLCPFEDVSMVGLAPEDVESFLHCVEEKCAILNATVTQRTKFMELIELEPSVQVGISIIRIRLVLVLLYLGYYLYH